MNFHGSIKKRLIGIILLVSTIASFTGYAGFVYWYMNDQYNSSVKLANTIGKVLSQDLAKLILLNEVSAAADITSNLKSFSMVNNMVLYNLKRKPIFQYSQNDKILEEELFQNDSYINKHLLRLYIDASYQSTHLGYVQLTIKIDTLLDVIKQNTIILIITLLFMFCMSYLLSIFFAKRFTRPILKLVSFLEDIGIADSLNKRIKTNENNEYGKLYAEVNTVLERIKISQESLKEKETMLIQQSKMVAMGEMLENIAHQWRQPLSVISTIATGMLMQKEVDMPISKDEEIKKLQEINDTTQHLSQTIEDFRNFFKQNKQIKVFYIKDIYKKTLALVSSKFRSLEIEVIENIEDIEINNLDNELMQALMNILNNAKDILETKTNQRKLIFIDIYNQNNNAIISVKDNAGGIPKNIINKIFEPYFTTKHKSQGTGIGLYMSKEMIHKHICGTLEVTNVTYNYDNIEYIGACFKIVIPIQLNKSHS